jgi:hypothetical protein
MAVAWMDKNDRVIAYTDLTTVTVSGIVFNWPSGDAIGENRWVGERIQPHSAAAQRIHSGRILLSRDSGAEFGRTLDDAVKALKTIWDVIQILASVLD